MIPLIVFMFVAATEPEPLTLPIACGDAICIVPREIVKAMMDAHNEQVDDIRKLEERVRHPKCAETTVVEPSRCLGDPPKESK